MWLCPENPERLSLQAHNTNMITTQSTDTRTPLQRKRPTSSEETSQILTTAINYSETRQMKQQEVQENPLNNDIEQYRQFLLQQRGKIGKRLEGHCFADRAESTQQTDGHETALYQERNGTENKSKAFLKQC